MKVEEEGEKGGIGGVFLGHEKEGTREERENELPRGGKARAQHMRRLGFISVFPFLFLLVIKDNGHLNWV